MAFGVFVVLDENTFHNAWNLEFHRFEQNDQMLHGAVSGANVNPAYGAADRLLHLGKAHGFEIFFHTFFLSLQMKKPSAS